MPVCPRCGKCLSSEQALNYHLNKKYKCGTWNCTKCDQKFDTKFDYKIHEMNCSRRTLTYCPCYDVLRDIYNAIPCMIYELDEGKIKNMNPGCKVLLGYDPRELEGREEDTITFQETNKEKWKTRIHKNKTIVNTITKNITKNWFIETLLESASPMGLNEGPKDRMVLIGQ